MNDKLAVNSSPSANHGFNTIQQNAIIMMAIENDSSTFPYNGCSGFGKMIANNRISPKTMFNNWVVQIAEKNNNIQPIKRNAQECIFRS